MILFIDKPSGITSFDAIRQMRRKLGIRKIGHAGTLDPLATGLLILATEKDTKKLTAFLKLDKEYEAEMELGKTSDTYDRDGKIQVIIEHPEISRENLDAALKEFVGEIEQTPPAYSAIKVWGKPAYKYARKGEKVELPSRKIRIFEIEVLDFTPPFVRLRVQCSSGTYIRSLVHELGLTLGTGAIVQNLRRTKVGNFVLNSVPLEKLI